MINSKELRKVEKRLGVLKRKAPVVMSRALNRAISNVNTNLSKESRKVYHLKAKTIRSTLTVKKSTKNNLGASSTSEGKRLPLKYYKVVPGNFNEEDPESSTPMKVAVRKGEGTKELLHSFIVDKLGENIFERKTRKRLPIKKLTAPAVPQTLKDRGIRKRVIEGGWEVYYKRLDHEISRELERVK